MNVSLRLDDIYLTQIVRSISHEINPAKRSLRSLFGGWRFPGITSFRAQIVLPLKGAMRLDRQENNNHILL